MKNLGMLAACMFMATGGGAYAQAAGDCVAAATAAAEAAGKEVTEEQAEQFCSCFHPIASESEEIKEELKANEGFPAPGEESEKLSAAIDACRP